MQEAHTTPEAAGDLRFDPSVFAVGHDYQIIFLTARKGIGWIEIAGERFTDEECGLLQYGRVHKIPVPGAALSEAGAYTVVFAAYEEMLSNRPVGVETVRKTYRFTPLSGDSFRLFQFADTHGRVESALQTFEASGGCDILLLNGDLNSSSDSTDQFDTAFRLSAGAVHGERPVINARGNHDMRGAAATVLPAYIPTVCRGGRRETFYTFRQGLLWGLVLDCGEDKIDSHVEYGGSICCDAFRRRETQFLESLLTRAEQEYDAPGVLYRIAFCHMPFVEKMPAPFDPADDIYETWTSLLNRMNIQLLLAGHMHAVYELPPHAPGTHGANFPTAVLSIPAARCGGGETYVGGVLTAGNGHVTARAFPDPASLHSQQN